MIIKEKQEESTTITSTITEEDIKRWELEKSGVLAKQERKGMSPMDTVMEKQLELLLLYIGCVFFTNLMVGITGMWDIKHMLITFVMAAVIIVLLEKSELKEISRLREVRDERKDVQ